MSVSRSLEDFRALIEGRDPSWPSGDRPPVAEDVTRALQVLLVNQCLYPHSPGLSRVYDLVVRCPVFFERYFAALGYELVIRPQESMVALSVPAVSPRHDAMYVRLKKDETLVLLTLKVLRDEGLSEFRVGEDGAVACSTNDIVDRLATLAGTPPPDETRLLDILRTFQRRGAVRTGERERESRVTPVSVLPGIDILVPDAYVENLMRWARSGADGDEDA